MEAKSKSQKITPCFHNRINRRLIYEFIAGQYE